MESSLKNTVVVITGASAGIGRVTALAFAQQGAHVALLARRQEALEELAEECRQYDVKAQAYPVDISQRDQLSLTIETIAKDYGQLNIVIGNHGILCPSSVETTALDDWDKVIDVNLKANMHLAHFALPHLKACRKTHPKQVSALLFNASIAAKHHFAKLAAYCASKAGLVSFAHCLFEAVREEGIKVSAVLPGMVNTSMAAGEKLNGDLMIQANDVADAFLYLATSPNSVCPVEMVLRPQFSPYR